MDSATRDAGAASTRPAGRDRRAAITDGIRRQAREHPVRTGWLVSFAFWLIYVWYAVRLRGMSTQPLFDEWFYWVLGSGITDRVQLTDYANPLRGVGFPLVISWVSSGLGLVEPGPRGTAVAISLVCVPLLTAVIAPSLVTSLGASGRRPGLLRILLFNVFVLVFWRNDVVRLLSDIPALTALAGGVAVLAHVARSDRNLDLRGAAAILGAGVLFAFGANTRPAYLVAVGVAVVAIPVLRWGASIRSTATVIGVVVAGLLIGFAPQVAANRHQGVGWSVVPAASDDLASSQLQFGLRYQRYETYIGPADEYPTAKMEYDNTPNLRGLDPADATSFRRYAQMFGEQPLAIVETTARHAFNGLDIRSPGSLIDDVHAPVVPMQILNFTLLLAAGWILGIRSWRWWTSRHVRDRRSAGTERRWPAPAWFAAVLVAASAPTLVSAVETRFLVGLHLFVGAVVVLTGRRSDLPERTAVRVGVAVAAVVVIGSALAFSASVAESLTPAIPVRPVAAPAGS